MEYKNIRHLLVDEMQDYTPVQYAVLAKLFKCNMTILGDAYQSVNPYSSSSVEKIQSYFEGAVCEELYKSYRSTIEITKFMQKIIENKKLIPIERHGKEPAITVCERGQEQLVEIIRLIDEFRASKSTSLGVICRSQAEAKAMFDSLNTETTDIHLLDFCSEEFQEGVVVTSVHMAKGLEFDAVIVPDASDEHYQTTLDRSLLYIACTRAMHTLNLTCYGTVSRFLGEI